MQATEKLICSRKNYEPDSKSPFILISCVLGKGCYRFFVRGITTTVFAFRSCEIPARAGQVH
jgi:hypothetical protein